MSEQQPKHDSFELDEPIDDGFGNVTETVLPEMANRAAALARRHPPTNPHIIISVIKYWTDISGYHDPIVKEAAAWLDYLLHDDVSQSDAGMTMDSHEALRDRLDELGIEVDDE